MAHKEIEIVTSFVKAYRRRLIIGRILWTAAVAGTGVALFIALMEMIFAFFPWTALPLIVDLAAGGYAVFVAGYCLRVGVLRAPDPLSIARMIEREGSVKHSVMSIALELAADPENRDNPFTGATCSRAVAALGGLPRKPPARPFSKILTGSAVALLLWCAINPVFSPRLIDYVALPFLPLARPEVVITPGSVLVPVNASVELKLLPRRGRFPSCRLDLLTCEGDRLSSALLRPDSTGGFVYRRDSVKIGFLYRFSLGASRFALDSVIVVPLPRINRLSVTVQSPAYTRRPPAALPEGQGSFDAYQGSSARITVGSPYLKNAWVVVGSDSIALVKNGGRASGTLRVTAHCSYSFAIEDSLGQRNDSLPRFHIGCLTDEPPSVQILKPGFNKELQPAQVETLWVEGVDDIGIRSLSLKWRKNADRSAPQGERDLTQPGLSPVMRVAFIWHLAELGLYPGDTVRYWAAVRDTKPFGPPQEKSSDTFWFRIPGFEEIHRRMAKEGDAAEKTLGGVRGRQRDIEERLRSAAKSAGGRKELSWEQQQALREVQNDIASQADSLRAALQSLQEHISQMKREGSVGEEIAKKMDQVRKAMEELVKQYGDSLLAALRPPDRPVSLNEMREAVRKAMSMLPKLDEQLDNVLKFLAALKRDRKLADLAMRAERLSKEQAALARDENRSESAAARQKELLDRIGELSKEVGLQKSADSSTPTGGDSLMSKTRLDSLQKSMQAALQRRALPSRDEMNRMSGSLLSLSDELMQMMSAAAGLRAERERARLLNIARDGLALADWQEEIRRNGETSSIDRSATAQAEQALKDALKKSRSAAESLSLIAPADLHAINGDFEDALAASESVIGSLKSSNGAEEMDRSGDALRMIGGAALAAIANMDNGQQQGAGGACMMPGLRRAAGRQASVNGATASLLRSLFGESPGPSQEGGGGGREEARRAAQKAQQSIADELGKLMQGGEGESEGLGKRVGDLAEEARRLAAMFDRPGSDLAERQDRFLSRMLETTLSMHREGEGKDEWKSRTAEKIFEAGVPAGPGDFLRDADTFHRLRQRAFLGNFPEEYRGALRNYFDALGEKYLK
jgi:hypothetical protein